MKPQVTALSERRTPRRRKFHRALAAHVVAVLCLALASCDRSGEPRTDELTADEQVELCVRTVAGYFEKRLEEPLPAGVADIESYCRVG